ncbi:MAG: response regulator [Bacteroidota bacterium]
MSGANYKKVMVIDDTELDRFIADRVLRKYNFAEQVVMVDSARAGLDYLKSLVDSPQELPQLIFLDIRMPDIDGFGFLEQYAELPEVIRKNSIIMMLSTSLDSYDHERARNNPYVSKFLNKPLSKEKLIEI